LKIRNIARSYSEVKTRRTLENRLNKAGYKIFASVRLSDVIEVDERELDELSDAMYRYSHFDFVVTKGAWLTPCFAVEFDGPHHETDKAQRRRDAIKNMLCKKAGFSLLRITSRELEQYEKVSVLSYMLELYLAWQKEAPGILKEIKEYIQENPHDPAWIETQQTGIVDPSLDPTVIFQLRHPFPPILTVVQRLKKKHIYTPRTFQGVREYIQRYKPKFILECWYAEHKEEPSGDFHKVTKTYYLIKRPIEVTNITFKNGKILDNRIKLLYVAEQSAKLKWAGPASLENESSLDFLSNIPEEIAQLLQPLLQPRATDIFFYGLPGVHIPDITEEIAEYLTLKEIEEWAFKNLNV